MMKRIAILLSLGLLVGLGLLIALAPTPRAVPRLIFSQQST
jgi:hypothetical protein